MATRITLKEAQELKEKFEEAITGIEIRIIDNSSVTTMGRAAAESSGFEIVEEVNAIFVKVKETRYEILEARNCTCGEEILTRAIGEAGADECPDCEQGRKARQTARINTGIEREAATVKELTWRDKWEQA